MLRLADATAIAFSQPLFSVVVAAVVWARRCKASAYSHELGYG